MQSFHVVARDSTRFIADKQADVVQYCQWLQRHLQHERPVTGLSEAFAVSAATLRRRFIAEMRCSPKQYQARWRLEQAAVMLDEDQQSIAAIARAVGYHSPHALVQAFKRATGVTPGQWRAGQRPERDVFTSTVMKPQRHEVVRSPTDTDKSSTIIEK